jgi:hypothetical protein
MPTVNWDDYDDSNMNDYSDPLPAGRYLCEVSYVDASGVTKGGDEMWLLYLRVIEPEAWRDRNLFDRLVFSQAAMKRVKFAAKRMGIPLEGEMTLEPGDILGKRVCVKADVESYIDGKTGQSKTRNVVPWAGYSEADEYQSPTTEPGSEGLNLRDLPF